jgi:Fe2+ or Zn2+ uptake regulation protein
MTKYRVYGLFTGSKMLGEFEAEDESEAIDMAAESAANHVSLCHHCSRKISLNDYSAQDFEAEQA